MSTTNETQVGAGQSANSIVTQPAFVPANAADGSHRIYERFPSASAPVNGVYRVFANDDMGKMDTLVTTKAIWEAVRGERSGDKGQYRTLGIRRFIRCSYLCHFKNIEGVKTLTGIDVIPNRYHIRGTSPLASADAKRDGFQLRWHDNLNGFELENFDKEGKNLRVGYLGMSVNDLIDVLQGLRNATWKGGKTQQKIENHPVVKLEPGLFSVKPPADRDKSVGMPQTSR